MKSYAMSPGVFIQIKASTSVFSYSATLGADGTNASGAAVVLPYWLKLVRQGNSGKNAASIIR